MEVKNHLRKDKFSTEAYIPRWRKYINAFVASELSLFTKYYDQTIQWMPRQDDTGMLLAMIEAPLKESVDENEQFPNLSEEKTARTVVLVNGTFNHEFDIQGLLTRLRSNLSRTSRLVAILYNPYLRWLYVLANRLRIRKGELPSTFVT